MLTTVDSRAMAVTVPATVVLGSAFSETTAGWPTASLVESVSEKPATTWRLVRSVRVMKAEEELDEALEVPDPEPPAVEPDPSPDPVPEPPVDAEAELDTELVDDEPEPLTVWPMLLFTAVIVPALGAVSVVAASVI